LPEAARHPAVERGASEPKGRFDATTLFLLVGIAVAVTVFRGAYEQIGNTVALWTDTGVDRHLGSWSIPMTWFISLNPLLVMVMTPPLLAWWRRRAEAGREQRPARKMAMGALIVAGAYVMLAALEASNGGQRSHWLWLAAFFAVFTFGELYILPTGLGLFARLAPKGLGATTVAAWYLATFAGSLAAGAVGAAWSGMPHATYFLMLAAIACVAAALLWLLDPTERRIAQIRNGTAESR
jgi:POT family proton-dependent oligopeptide transporter